MLFLLLFVFIYAHNRSWQITIHLFYNMSNFILIFFNSLNFYCFNLYRNFCDMATGSSNNSRLPAHKFITRNAIPTKFRSETMKLLARLILHSWIWATRSTLDCMTLGIDDCINLYKNGGIMPLKIKTRLENWSSNY